MLILFLNVVHYDIKPAQSRPCAAQNSLFTSDSQHPPRFGHAVYLGVLWKSVLPTNEEDPFKNEGARVVTTDLPL